MGELSMPKTMRHTMIRVRDSLWSTLLPKVASLELDDLHVDEDLYIYHHLGLGDMIHCNGLVRYLLTRLHADRRIGVFSKARNAEMVRWMYRDEPRIEIVEVPDGMREATFVQSVLRRRRVRNYLAVGHRAMRPLLNEHPHAFFDELFYLQMGIPYAYRYSYCYWERDMDNEERVFRKLAPQGPYAFVHDDASRGYCITTDDFELPVVRNDISESIFHMGLLLERAAEVHCMESSIRCMIESLNMNNTKLYYHNFRYPDRPLGRATQLDWEQIDRTQLAAA